MDGAEVRERPYVAVVTTDFDSGRISGIDLHPEGSPRGARISVRRQRPQLDALLRLDRGWHCFADGGGEVSISCSPTDAELLEFACELLASNSVIDGWRPLSADDRRDELVRLMHLALEDGQSYAEAYAHRFNKLRREFLRECGVDIARCSEAEIEVAQQERAERV